jgi:hypothetical protein
MSPARYVRPSSRGAVADTDVDITDTAAGGDGSSGCAAEGVPPRSLDFLSLRAVDITDDALDGAAGRRADSNPKP